MRAVVSGASIAGLSAAFWLNRIGWQVTVIEQAESFRDGGQNVDVRGVAHEVLDRMGLTAAVKARNTTETGTVIVDRDGAVIAELPSTGDDGATAELEVLRGDFARCILDALPAEVRFVYGDDITAVENGHGPVTVLTRSGQELRADLLVVAEGVRSTTRDLVFDDGTILEDDLGITMAFGTIARTEDDDSFWRWYTTTGGRQVHLRPDNHGTTRAILAFAGDHTVLDTPPHDAVAQLRTIFRDAGWQAPRVLDGFATTDDLYIDRLTQIRAPHWHRARVCLAGDAGWCVTPIGGGGASLALTAGYALAAYLSTEADIGTALDAYETWMRPLVDEVQKLPPGIDHLAYPRSRVGVALSRLASKAMSSEPLATLTQRLTDTTGSERPLPELVAST